MKTTAWIPPVRGQYGTTSLMCSPDQASALLQRNTHQNRALSISNANRIASDIAEGRWRANGDTIKFDCPLDNTYTITLRYKQGFALASTSTNWLMTNHPRVYLYGAQAEASLYTRDQAGMAMFESAFQQALSDANRAENYATELRVDAGMNSGMYNIYKDG